MSLLTTFETDAKDVFDAVATDLKELAAYVYGKLSEAGHAAESAVVADIPSIVSALKTYAEQEVKAIAADPAFARAAGSWQFGTVASLVLQAIERDFPTLATLAKGTLQGVIETAVQAAFAAFIVA